MNGVQRVFSISRRHLSIAATALALAACHTPVNEQPPAPELGSGYRTDLTTKMSGPNLPPAAQTPIKSSVESTYAGACPAGMKPGESRQGA